MPTLLPRTRRHHSLRRTHFELLESRLLLAGTPMSGTWGVAGLGLTGTLTFDDLGNISASTATDASGTPTSSGTFTFANHAFTLTTPGFTAAGITTAGNDVAIVTTPSIPGPPSPHKNSLTLLVKSAGSNFSNASLSGTWDLFYDGDQGDNTGAGSVTFDGNGNISGGSGTDLGGVTTILGGNYTVSSTGQVSLVFTTANGSPSLTGQLNANGDFLALSPASLPSAATNHASRLFVAVKAAPTYTLADLKGAWNLLGDGYNGQVTFSGTGAVTGNGADADGTPFNIKGTYTIVPSGPNAGAVTISAKGFPAANEPTSTAPTVTTAFHGKLSASKKLLTLAAPPFHNNATGESSADSLVFLANSGDTAPTLTTIRPFATAIDQIPFPITFAQLLAATNAADSDADPLAFQVTFLGSGDYALNDNLLTLTPFIFHPGDTLTWAPPVRAVRTFPAFWVKAFDGILTSAVTTPVMVKVAKPPTISITATKPSALEADPTKPGVITVTRTGGDLASPLNVSLDLEGTADRGIDYELGGNDPGGIVTFPANVKSLSFSFIATNDHLAEDPESITLAVLPDPAYTLGTKTEAAVTVVDDSPMITVIATKPNASEVNPTTSGAGIVTVTRIGGILSEPLTVNLDYLGAATENVDYTITAGNSVTFLPNQKTATITINPLVNLNTDAPNQLKIDLGFSTAYFPKSFGTSEAVITINHAKPAPASLAGRTLNATITAGTGTLSPSGTFQLVLNQLDDRYLILGSPTVPDSPGTFLYTYHRTSRTTATFTLSDPTYSDGEGVITFSSPSAATYTYTTATGTQSGKLSLAPIPATSFAPETISNRTAAAKIAAATGAFPSAGNFKIALGKTSDNYAFIGTPPLSSSSGTYTYEKFSPSVALITVTDSDHGNGTVIFTFSSATAATYRILFQNGDTLRGSLTFDPIPLATLTPTSLTGVTLKATIAAGTDPFAPAGAFQLLLNPDTYTLTGTPPLPNGAGTFTYQPLNDTVALLTFVDDDAGDSVGILSFTSLTKLSYLFLSQSSLGYQRGSMTIIPPLT